MTARASNVGTVLLWSVLGFALALLFALGAAHWYVPPALAGSSGNAIWAERDVQCSLASASIAVLVGLWSGRMALGATAVGAGSIALRALIWAGFTLLFSALWLDSLSLFTPLVAPTHAFACLRLVGLWGRWRSELIWRRRD